MPTPTELGAHGERIAAAYLTDAGLRVLDRNWRCRDGELDIVAREGDALVFCEVKTRRGTGYGQPVEAVDAGQAAPVAHAGPALAGRARRARAGAAVRRRRRAGAARDAGRGHPPPGGVLVTLARTWSVGLVGVRGAMVEVEVDMANGLPGVVLVGLPDAVVRQSVDRVRAAVVNAGAHVPAAAHHDRAVTGVHAEAGERLRPRAGGGGARRRRRRARGGRSTAWCCSASSGSTASVRAIRGVLPAVLAAARAGHRQVVVPVANADEAALVEGIEVLPGRDSRRAARAPGRPCAALPARARAPVPAPPPAPDLADVVGQAAGRRAVEVAAAGGHHLFLTGPPGAGKTMLAERLPGLLPPLDEQAALEVTAIHSIAGTLPPEAPLVTRPTVRGAAPLGHDGVARSAGVRGRSGPGALCRAHRGVLFLDEAPEFPRAVLDTLRQPLERGQVTIHRAAGSATFPCRAQLVLAANPCPVRQRRRRHGLHLQSAGTASLHGAAVRARCSTASTCGSTSRRSPAPRGSTASVRRSRPRWWPGGSRSARAVAAARLAGTGLSLNSQVPGRLLRERWPVPRAALAPGRAGARARRAVGPRVRPGPPGRLDARRPGRSAGARRRRGRRGARHAAAAGGGMTIDEDLEEAAVGPVGPGRGPSGAAPGTGVAEPGRRARHRRLLAVRRRGRSGRGRPEPAVDRRPRPGCSALVGARAERDESLADLRRAERCGARLVVPGGRRVAGPAAARPDPGRRGRTRRTAGRSRTGRSRSVPPVALWVRGPARLDELVDRSVAIVGSRASTAYGEHVAGELGHQLGERGWTVVSGGAYGIDAAAHRGALAAEAPTVAVLACGVDRAVPGRQRRVARPDRRERAAGQRVAAGLRAARGTASWSATG